MKKIYILLIFIIVFLAGCSEKTENNSNEYTYKNKSAVSRVLSYDKNWEVTVKLYWDLEEVIGVVESKYKGNKPLDYVIQEPNFSNSKWPEGYYPPNFGTYTWNAETPNGALPGAYETSVKDEYNLSRKPSRLMSSAEAENILKEVKVNIQWKPTEGDILKTVIE